MTLSHFSNEAIEAIHDTPQTDYLYKPNGLWLSVDGEYDWSAWCVSEGFKDTTKQYHYVVTLSDAAHILYLSTDGELLAFSEKYRFPLYPSASSLGSGIDWKTVASLYDGIIIAPYSWGLRLDLMWYYGWDCASGCIWNSRAVKSFAVVHDTDLEWI